MKKPLLLVVGVGALVITMGIFDVTPAAAAKRHLVWDKVDMQWICVGSSLDCNFT